MWAASGQRHDPGHARHAHLRQVARELVIATGEREDGDPGVDWRAEYVYPGLRPARSSSARRRSHRARRSRPATAPRWPRARTALSDLGPLASEIAGRVGPTPPERAAGLAKRGIPRTRPSDDRAGAGIRHSGSPGPPAASCTRAGGSSTRKSVSGRRSARGSTQGPARRDRRPRGPLRRDRGRRNPKNGEVLALAGIALSAPQPPG